MFQKLKNNIAYVFKHDVQPREHLLFTPHSLSDVFLLFGGSVLFFLFFLVTFSTLEFILGVPMLSYHLIVSFIFTFLFLVLSGWYFFKELRIIKIAISFLLFVIAISVSLIIANSFIDVSYDGQAYHQEAIFQLSEGWNPLHTQLTSEESNNLHRWLNHYPKAAWVYETSIFLVTGNVEDGKLFNPLLLFTSFAFIFATLLSIRKMNPILAFFISLVAALNPVTLYQLASYYLDGQIASYLLCLFAILILIFLRNSLFSFILLFFLIALIFNIKLNTGVYAVIFLAFGFGILWLANKVMRAYKLAGVSALAIFYAVFIIGFNPFIFNTIYKGHPLYPAAGKGAVNYTEGNLPENLWGKVPPVVVLSSFYSVSDTARGKDRFSNYKIPFLIGNKELKAFEGTSPKTGGFGVFYSGAFTLAMILLIAAFLYTRSSRKKAFGQIIEKRDIHNARYIGLFRHENKKVRIALYLFLAVLVSGIINPLGSVARYVPHLWLLPIIVAVLIMSLRPILFKLGGFFILAILFINSIMIATVTLSYNQEMTDYMVIQLKNLSREQNEPIKIYFSQFRTSGIYRFDEYGVDYQEIKTEEECVNGKRLFRESVIMKCE